MAVRADGRTSGSSAPSRVLPALLTVEEAADLLRIGRTKAYAMAREWRATGGRSGLPVVDFGHVLRVPLRALERVIGAELGVPQPDVPRDAVTRVTEAPGPTASTPPESTAGSRRAGRPGRRARSSSQLNLFGSAD